VKLRAEKEPALTELLQPIFRQRTAAEWLALFESSGVPCAPVLDYAEVCEDFHVKQTGILCPLVLPGGAATLSVGNPLRMTDYAFQVTRNPPALGEHGAEVFEDWLETKQPGQTHAR
jgi:crotonobetainyl-CoA:carnitine CoA-transferase CaiB-like acyl-CoA transferase